MTPRNSALLLADDIVRCPHGHAVSKHFWSLGEFSASGYRCQALTPPGDKTCGVSLVVLPFMRAVVEVTTQELSAMDAQRLSIRQIRDLLGLTWPKVA